MPGHSPMMGMLADGPILIRPTEGDDLRAYIHEGFCTVDGNRVIVLAEWLELASRSTSGRPSRSWTAARSQGHRVRGPQAGGPAAGRGGSAPPSPPARAFVTKVRPREVRLSRRCGVSPPDGPRTFVDNCDDGVSHLRHNHPSHPRVRMTRTTWSTVACRSRKCRPVRHQALPAVLGVGVAGLRVLVSLPRAHRGGSRRTR